MWSSHQRTIQLATGIIVLLMIGSCKGPQSLEKAIRPTDETDYLTLARESDGLIREAFYLQQAEKFQDTPEEARKKDIQLSRLKNPFDAKNDLIAVSRGAVLYKYQCASCHGFAADGQGPDMPVYLPEMDFRRPGRRFSITLHGGAPKKWFRVISEGVKVDAADNEAGVELEMPAYDTLLSREQIWLVVTYLQSFEHD